MTEAELLFTDTLDCNRLFLYLNRKRILTKGQTERIALTLKRRLADEPIQYILGKAEFMGLEFHLTPDVFIPRQETEILVEKVIELVSCVMCHVSCVNILDVGTGSGCIAISLAKFLPQAKITATDISRKAIGLAEANAKLNKVAEQIKFIKSDLFTSYELRVTSYDIIISNPPYIPTGEIGKLQPELQYEPRISLDGGKDGLDFYRRIIREAPDYLKEDGVLIMEMGFGQVGAIKNIFENSGNFEIIETIKDYNSIERVIVARRLAYSVERIADSFSYTLDAIR